MKTKEIREIIKDFEVMAAQWFDYNEKCQSGGQGYPKQINFEPTSHTNRKQDKYSDYGVPRHLRKIHNLMMDMPEDHRKVFEQKLTKKYPDSDRATALHVSKAQYHIRVREAHSFVLGYMRGVLTDRIDFPAKEMA